MMHDWKYISVQRCKNCKYNHGLCQTHKPY